MLYNDAETGEMRVRFYGTRGSIPTPGSDYSTYGGNTTCLMVTGENGNFGILDAGSGLRVLGDELLRDPEPDRPIPILLSHTHWDHIQGFPFFKPAFDPRRKVQVVIHGREKAKLNLQQVFAGQMDDEYFPIPLGAMGADISFDRPDLSDVRDPEGWSVRASLHSHPGGAYGYRLTGARGVIAYCTDVEHDGGVIDDGIVELARDADLL